MTTDTKWNTEEKKSAITVYLFYYNWQLLFLLVCGLALSKA